MHWTPPESFNAFDYFLGDRILEGMGDRRALLTDAGDFSYGDVYAMSGRYANLLARRGVRPEERVIVALPDGADYVGALFGILRLGAVVVMVNPHLAPEQIRYFFEYTRARAAFVDTDVASAFVEAGRAARHAPELIEVGADGFSELLGRESAERVPFASHRDDAAIWLFSGGTTGRPKAVVQSHRSFANTTERYGKGVLGMVPEDITLSVPKLFFGYATGTNLLFPFSVGATAALFPERCTAETLFAKIAAFRPTILVNVPTMVNNLLSHESAAEQDLSCLRLATSAGEALPAELHRRWNETFGAPLLDGLGTAEMWHVFISNRPEDIRPGTLGRVVPGFEVRVRDQDGRELGPDEVGYLWVRGDSRANEYWQNAEETRQAFRGEWYVSGDMISIDAEGYVTYCGRADDMLKVSGKWLSPKDVENCLLEHESVREVAVVGVTTGEGLIKPHAFVRTAEGVSGDDALATALQEWVKSRLEPYKYPREVTFLDDLPRTHLGKVDRGRLARGA
jgi:benzoate-CoA ligase family protein